MLRLDRFWDQIARYRTRRPHAAARNRIVMCLGLAWHGSGAHRRP